MSDTQMPDYHRGYTFEDVWAGLMEVRELQKENAIALKETAAQREKDYQELREAQEKSREDFDRQVKEYNKRFGYFTNQYGKMIEYLVAPNMLEKFRKIGLDFGNIYQDAKLSNKKLNIAFQIDLLLEDGDKAMLVEVKSELETKDVKKHVERLEKMRQYADAREDKRTFLGAVAAIIITPDAREYALEQGFFVVEPSGETFDITQPEGKAREW
jgi:hypothetical protein